ncbi:nucleotide sugar dehydrogenase [Enterococcus faecium]|uniref:UDP-glucose/GDP-mannose dehydrogenase C-terminal domain-containing protein n=1 Tax=Enterococcus faecium TaxID=1352 RepID=A0A242BDX8_ENTFC|nr:MULTISPECIES: nucleotide sugar dehydrogenase [Enterococcus]EGP5329993.1 nucleotide sugar dehydrogenase [Enterococcus faecium]EGP5740068.1 nucleotide sugar dehydrogenase [Enterococcus faecium]ELB56212.1 nucleotide sugar dehydrogenase [Enterococcus faecium EnGen0056]EOI43695.1 nucleotide sugar dehydrogenase [Enterococcus faecium EnGen0315]MDQ8320920.1 nucleotide sugar dehydrogenase [Enterococcus faecium]
MINVIGLGYIGLPTALMLAANGNEVVGTDYNQKLLHKLQEGQLTFEEKGLEELFDKALTRGIKFENEYSSTDFYIITVPTPYDKVDKKIDPSYVIAATKRVLEVCKKGTILVIESTISPGTIDRFVRPLVKEAGLSLGEDVHLVHAPERILPGQMIKELQFNSRTIGADEPEIAEKVKEIYSTFCEGEIVCTDIRTAEMTKVVENTFRAINIAYANELTKIARHDGLDVHEIIRIANMHPRVNILSPGPGVGGHCIPVDPWFLVGDYPRLTQLISTALEINESMPELVLERLVAIMKENNITDKNKIGIYGMTYKQDVDDIRESPTVQLFEKMKSSFAEPFRVFDPMIKEKIMDNQVMDFDKFLNDSEIIVLMVEHTHLKENLSMLQNKLILDTHNLVENAYKL